MSGLKNTPGCPTTYTPGKWGEVIYPKRYSPGWWGLEVHRTPSGPRPPWEKAWTPTPPSRKQIDIAQQTAARRAQEQAQRQAEQARSRERSEQEARVREARERQREEQQPRPRVETKRQQVDQQRQRQREELARQAAIRARQAQQQRTRQQVDAMLDYHKSFGKKWMAERGPFGLSGTLRPLGKVLGKVLAKTFEVGGYLSPSPIAGGASLGLANKFEQDVREIEKYEDFLRAQAQSTEHRKVTVTPDAAKPDGVMKPVAKYEVLVAGIVKESLHDKIVKDISRSFADRLLEQQFGNPGGSMNKISIDAHKLVQEVDLPDICRKYGIKAHQVEVEPISGVTGSRGGQVRYDVGLFKRRAALIELKSSAYKTERTALQLQAHQIGVGEKTATYGKAGDYYRIYAKERLIEKWTGEDLARALQAQRPQAPKARPIRLRFR